MSSMHELLTPEGIQKSFGFECDTHKVALLMQHLRMLMQTNATLNLTRICDEEEMLELHLWDSLTALPSLKDAQDGTLLDLGTGGGFPGIPLGIVSERKTVLLDSVKKKARAVDGFIEQLDLKDHMSACGMRAEEYASEFPCSISVVTARAVTRLGALVELASPLLTKNGLLVAMKGQYDPDEEQQANKVAEIVGMKQTNVQKFNLPISKHSRTIYVYEKVGTPKIRLPRKNGYAQKRPLP